MIEDARSTLVGASQPAGVHESLASEITPFAPGEPVPDAATLVREVRQAENWIVTVRTFRVQARAKWTRSPEQIAARRAELQKQFPQARVDTETFPELRPESDESLDLAFDTQRLYKREESPNGSRLLDVRIWDGKRAIMHEQYPRQEHYALDKEPSRLIGQFFLASLGWPRSGSHTFWWLPEPQRQGDDEFYGRPEEFACVGRAQFRGAECYVLEREQFYWRYYVGVADHRLHAIEQRALPRDGEQSGESIMRQLAREQGQHLDSRQQIEQWIGSLSADARQSVHDEYFRRLRPFSVPSVLSWYADYREVAPGCWMPMTMGQRNYLTERHGRGAITDCVLTITNAQVDAALPDDLFTMQLREGVQVYDWGHEPPLFYKHKDHFTPQEWQAILDEANQRERDQQARIAGMNSVVGQPAPDFPAEAQWLNSAPRAWADLRGKVVILDFWSIDCGPCRNDFGALNELHKRRESNQIVILSLHTAGASPDDVQKLVKQYELAYPICIDTPIAIGWGRLFGAYHVTSIPHTFVMDQAGRIAGHGSLADALGIANRLVADAPAPISAP